MTVNQLLHMVSIFKCGNVRSKILYICCHIDIATFH